MSVTSLIRSSVNFQPRRRVYGRPLRSAGGYPAIVDTPPRGTKQFFAGGRNDVSTAAQDIDLSANANDIDTGRIICDVSAWLGGYSDQEDSAKLTIEFRSNTTVNLKSITLGSVTALERSDQTGLRYRSSSLSVLARTRRIHAELILTRKSDAGPWNDGYADNLSIILHGRMAGNTVVNWIRKYSPWRDAVGQIDMESLFRFGGAEG